MRLFFAIELSDDLKEGLSQTQQMFRAKGVLGNYTPAENMHLTVAFIGEHPDPQEILEALDQVHFRAFPLTTEGIGQFTDLWWAGIRKEEKLDRTVRSIRHALADHDIPFDRRKFRGHITLLRQPVYTRGENLSGITVPQRTMTVDRIILMRSDRGKRGMIYTPVGEIPADPII